MALHAVAAVFPAAAVVALSGRLAGPVAPRLDWPPITLLHGASNSAMPIAVANATEVRLRDAGASSRLIVIDGLGHSIDARVLAAFRDTQPPFGGTGTTARE